MRGGLNQYLNIEPFLSRQRRIRLSARANRTSSRGGGEDRIGTGPPRARTEVIYVDLGYWAISGSIHPKGGPVSWGINSAVFRGAGGVSYPMGLVATSDAKYLKPGPGCRAISRLARARKGRLKIITGGGGGELPDGVSGNFRASPRGARSIICPCARFLRTDQGLHHHRSRFTSFCAPIKVKIICPCARFLRTDSGLHVSVINRGMQGYLARKKPPPPPRLYSSSMPNALCWCYGGGVFSCVRGTPVHAHRLFVVSLTPRLCTLHSSHPI